MAIAKRLVKPTPEQQRAKRIAQLDSEKAYFEQLKLTQQEQREQQQAERNAFLARIATRRKAETAAAERGEQLQHEPIPHLRDVWAQTRAEELQRQAEAEQARINALTPRELWVSTLTWQEQQRIAKWETVNRMPYPIQLD